MSNESPVIALAEPFKVQVSQINKQLSRIWTTQIDGATRASTFNLLFFGPETMDPNAITESVGAIAVQHPCRAIVISANAGAPETGIEAFVAAYCPVSDAGTRESVCCEYITLKANGQALEELHSTAASLLLPELETFLWWAAPLNRHLQLFTNLQSVVDRTIVDSSLFETPEKSLIQLIVLALAPDRRTSFGDLNWSRLTPWREETALAFDSEERSACLGALDQIIIEYGQVKGESMNPIQGLLYLGWLASRLGWQPLSVRKKEGIRQIILRNSDHRPVQVTLRATTTGVELAGQLTSVGLRSEEMAGVCSTVLCSADSSSCLRVQTGIGDATASRVADLEQLSTEQLLAEAMQTPNHDPIYEQALGAVDAILRLMK